MRGQDRARTGAKPDAIPFPLAPAGQYQLVAIFNERAGQSIITSNTLLRARCKGPLYAQSSMCAKTNALVERLKQLASRRAALSC